ncbi:MAG: iron-containing alcohol dehydrogenase [Planctomycetia bacterium]
MNGELYLPPFDFHQRTRLIFGAGSLGQLATACRELHGTHVLIVTDSGLRRAGHCRKAENVLAEAGLRISIYDQVPENPTSDDVNQCTEFARSLGIDLLIGLGGGSSMDCAKGTNFLLTNGGTIHDYKGMGRASRPMLPMIAVPTTSGTGSEAQSFAVIADAKTHLKMACGDPRAACRVAILDPELTLTMPFAVTAATGIDAMTHAIESYVTTRRNSISQMFARQAWALLSQAFPTVLGQPENLQARGSMQLGAFLAGAAIENSMLGAAHAAANPLTAQFGTTHGIAVGLMMPSVIRWNSTVSNLQYQDLLVAAQWATPDHPSTAAADLLAEGFSTLLQQAGLPTKLGQLTTETIDSPMLQVLAEDAAQQWTGTFNPRKMDVASFVELYHGAL